MARAAAGRAAQRAVTMAQAALGDGRVLYAFNDLFIGPRSHTSARYRLEYAGQAENQSSSGLIVSTGAGSTGWLQSVVNGARFSDGGGPECLSLNAGVVATVSVAARQAVDCARLAFGLF